MVTAASKGKDSAAQPRKISWSEFEKRYLTREDKYKYEWLNGIVEKTEPAINQYQLFIAENLILFFEKLRTARKVSGLLISEVDTFFLENHRKPDFSYFTSEQIARAADGENQVPLFVIEIISTHDKTQKTQRKIQDYQAAGVQVTWEIMPILQQMRISG